MSQPTSGAAVYSLYIINKSGGLIFQKDLVDGLARLDTNEALTQASIWCERPRPLQPTRVCPVGIHVCSPRGAPRRHSLHAISAQLSPVQGCTGMQVRQTLKRVEAPGRHSRRPHTRNDGVGGRALTQSTPQHPP
jgi:hypothetical protein